jgi:hypothetical protein
MRRMIQPPVLTVLGLCLAGAPLLAQSLDNGQIHGAIKDPAGKPVPGARLTLSSPHMQGTRTIVTNSRGEFLAPLLLPGVYRIAVHCPGYVGCTVEGIRVGAGAAVRQDMVIKSAEEASAVVVVDGSSLAVDKADTKTSVDFDSDSLLQMTGGRTMGSALSLVAGVNPGQYGGQYSIRGGTGNNTQMTLNGVPIADPLQGNVTGDYYIEDNVEDVAVVLSPANARFGRMLGGGVNVVTKSGSNEFAGSIRQSMSRGSWRGRNYSDDWYDPSSRTGGNMADAIARDTYVTVSGPVVKDKVWFSYGTHLKPSSSYASTLPDSSSWNSRTRIQRTNIPGLDALTYYDPTSGALLNPTAQTAGYGFPPFDAGKGYLSGSIYTYHEGKVTWAVSQDHRIQIYGSHSRSGETHATDGGTLFLNQLTEETGTNQQWGFSYNGILGASTFVEIEASRNKSWANYALGNTSFDPTNTPVNLTLDAYENLADPTKTVTHQYQGLGNVAGSGLGPGDEERDQANYSINVKMIRSWGTTQHDIDMGVSYFQGDIHSLAYYGAKIRAVHVGGMLADSAGDWLFPVVDWAGKSLNGQSANGQLGLAPVMEKYYGNNGHNGYEVNRNRAIYFNDQMTLSPKWNLMVGLRVDGNDMLDGVSSRKVLPTTTGISPRLVLTYDLKGDNSRVLKFSFLRLQSDFPTSMTNALFTRGDSKMIRYGWSAPGQPAAGTPNDLVNGVQMYGLRFVSYADLLNESNYGTPFAVQDSTRNYTVAPGFKPQGNNELSVEYRRQFTPGSYFRTAFVHREYDHIVAFSRDYYSDQWMANPNTAAGQPAYIPGPMNQWRVVEDFTGGSARSQYIGLTHIFNSPDLNRQYNGLELEASSKVNSVFSWRLTYTYSRTAGNTDTGEMSGSPFIQGIGLSTSDGFNNANFLKLTTGKTLAQTSPNGALLGDRPHQANLTLMAVLPVGKGWVSYSLVGTYTSGSNWTATMAAPFEGSMASLSNTLASDAKVHLDQPVPVSFGGTTWNQYYSARGAYHQNDLYNVDLNVAFEIPIAVGVKAFGYMTLSNVFNHIYQQYYDRTALSGASYGGLTQFQVDKSVFGGTHGEENPQQDHYSYFSGPRSASLSLGLKF